MWWLVYDIFAIAVFVCLVIAIYKIFIESNSAQDGIPRSG